MKISKLIKYLIASGCELAREGSRYSIWRNMDSGNLSAVPRHKELKEQIARKICKDLKIKII